MPRIKALEHEVVKTTNEGLRIILEVKGTNQATTVTTTETLERGMIPGECTMPTRKGDKELMSPIPNVRSAKNFTRVNVTGATSARFMGTCLRGAGASKG